GEGVVGLGRWIAGGRPGLGPGELNQDRPIWVERRRSDGRPGSSLRLAGAAALVPRGGGLAGDEGHGRLAGLWGNPSGRGGREGTRTPLVGVWVGAEARRGAVHGGAARRRGYSTPASNQTQQRAKQGAIGAGEVPYLKAGSGDSSAATETRRGPGSTVAAARRTTGERGQREIGRGRGNWGAFRLRTSGRSSPGLRARRSSNGDEEPSSGRRGLWRRRSACAQRGGKRVYWAQMGGEGEGEWGSGTSGRGRGGASPTRDVGAGKAGASSSAAVTRGRRG
ncbi:hypothetical protein Zm00014a_018199, partial [Zea mays]